MLFKDIKNWIVKHQNNLSGDFALKRAVLLAAMICSIIRSGRVSLQKLGEHMDGDIQLAIKIKKAKRFLKNKHLNAEIHFIPYLSSILKSLIARGKIVLAVDGSGIGKDCSVLMVNIIWKTRAIPICWIVRKASKGHFAEQLHIDIVKQTANILKPFVDQKCKIVFLGDGEFDGRALQQTTKNYKWFYVLKTAKSTYINENNDGKDACKIGDNLPNAYSRH